MSYDGLPGWELVEPGLADLARGVESVNALLVAIGAPLGGWTPCRCNGPARRTRDGPIAKFRYVSLEYAPVVHHLFDVFLSVGADLLGFRVSPHDLRDFCTVRD